MANSTASLISSLAPDATGFNQILETPPGTQMFYDSLKRNPQTPVGGYGLRENDRHAAQMNEYMDALWKVNAQRQGLAKNLLANEDRDSVRKLLGSIYGKAVDSGNLGGLGTELADALHGGNSVGPEYDSFSDQQSTARNQAETFAKMMEGVDAGGRGGLFPRPEGVAGVTNVPVDRGTPTGVAASAAGGSANDGSGWTQATQVNSDGSPMITTYTQHGRGAGPGPGPAPAPGSPPPGAPPVPVGSPKQQAAIVQWGKNWNITIPIPRPDGTVEFYAGKRGFPPSSHIILDQEGNVHSAQ